MWMTAGQISGHIDAKIIYPVLPGRHGDQRRQLYHAVGHHPLRPSRCTRDGFNHSNFER